MNQHFKVVFNKVRGALMVVNEVTSSVQAKGTKTVVAAVAAVVLGAGSGMAAAESQYEALPSTTPTFGATQSANEVVGQGKSAALKLSAPSTTPLLNVSAGQNVTIAQDQKLWVISEINGARASGVWVSGDGSVTNQGTVYVNGATSYQNRALGVDKGTATNEGTIVAKNAYGMTVGSNGGTDTVAAKLINKGTIVVEQEGIGMELGGIGSTKQTLASGVNEGTITVLDVTGAFSAGVMIQGESGSKIRGQQFVNSGSIENEKVGNDHVAVGIKNAEGSTFTNNGKIKGTVKVYEFATDTKIVLGAKSVIDGKLDVVNTAVSAAGATVSEVKLGAGSTLETTSNTANQFGTISVAQGASVNNQGTILTKAAAIDGTVQTKIPDWQALETTVNATGVLNITALNSKTEGSATEDRLFFAGTKTTPVTLTMNGGKLQVAGEDYHGAVKVGGADDGEKQFGAAILNITSGEYQNSSVQLANSASQLNIKGGKLSVTSLDVKAGKVTTAHTVNAEGKDTAIQPTLAAEKVSIAQGAKLENGGTLAVDHLTISGTVTTSISQPHYRVKETTLEAGGVLNLAALNSNSQNQSDGTKDRLILAWGDQSSTMTFNLYGGELQVAGQKYEGAVKLGGSNTGKKKFGGAIFNIRGDYTNSTVELANSASAINVESGTYTVDTLNVLAGTVTTARTVNEEDKETAIQPTLVAQNVNIAHDAQLNNGGTLAVDHLTIAGTVATSISQPHYRVKETTLEAGGVLNLAALNSNSKNLSDGTKDRLILAWGDQSSTMTFNLYGGELQVAGQKYEGAVKLGGSNTGKKKFGGAIFNIRGDYTNSTVELANSASAINVESGTYTVDTLNVLAGTVTTARTVNEEGKDTAIQPTLAAEKVSIAQGAKLENGGTLAVDQLTIAGTVATSISQPHYRVKETTLEAGGVLNLAALNSNSQNQSDGPKDRLILAWGDQSSTMTFNFNGGELQVGGQKYEGAVKLGGANDGAKKFGGAIFNIANGEYQNSSVQLANSASQLNVTGGSYTVGTLAVDAGAVSVKGGTLTIDNLSLGESGMLTLDGGALKTTVGQLYKSESGDSATLETNPISLKNGITLSKGTLTLLDRGEYTTDVWKQMAGGNQELILVLPNATVKKEEGKDTIDLIDSTVVLKEDAVATGSVQGDPTSGENGKTYAAVSVPVKDAGVQTLQVTAQPSGEGGQSEVIASKVVLTAKASETSSFTLGGTTGQAQALVTNAENKVIDLELGSGMTLNLGSTSNETETQGTLKGLVVGSDEAAMGAKVNIAKMAVKAETIELKAGSQVNVGHDDARGVLVADRMTVARGSTLFLDPVWTHTSADTIENASQAAFQNLDLSGAFVIGRNSFGVYGSTLAEGIAAFHNLGYTWGEGQVEAAFYLAKNLTVEGTITIDGSQSNSATDSPEMSSASGSAGHTINVAANSLLMLDGSSLGTDQVLFDGTINLEGKVAIVNARPGTFKVATTVTNEIPAETSETSPALRRVVRALVESTPTEITPTAASTDNPFLNAQISAGSGTAMVSTNTQALSEGISSLGMQSMLRRADMVLSQTIADRVASYQTMGRGLNLWADVRGEKYKADDFAQGGNFSSNMGYGTFGADLAVTDRVTAGLALQYGKGKLDSDSFNIKNDVDNVGVSLYGTLAATDSVKVLGELAYLQGGNDIKMVDHRFDQTVDAHALSAGVSAQVSFDFGGISVIPSAGVRVSRLHTDGLWLSTFGVDAQNQTIWQVPLAVRVQGQLSDVAGWQIAPTAKVAFVPSFGDKDINALGTDVTVLDMAPMQADFGVMARHGNLMLDAGFQMGAGKHGTRSVGGKVGVKYLF